MKTAFFALYGVLFVGALAAGNLETIEYEASYLGVPLLDMTLTWSETDSSVSIRYDNQLKPFIAFFHSIHNIYEVEFYQHTYEPIRWSKDIAEGSKRFVLSAERSGNGPEVKYSNNEQRMMPSAGFTVFSATHFLASKANDPEFFPRTLKVLIDGEIWEADANRYTRQTPHPDHDLPFETTLIQADLHYIEGKRVMKENDILMDVIAREGTRFLLWVAPDGHFTKAQFGEFPKAVVLNQLD